MKIFKVKTHNRKGKVVRGHTRSRKDGSKWIQKAIKRPGRMVAYAKRLKLPLSKAIEKAKTSKNKSLRFAGFLAERLRSWNKKKNK